MSYFIPKRWKKRIFGMLRRQLGEIFHELAGHKESQIVEGHMMGAQNQEEEDERYDQMKLAMG